MNLYKVVFGFINKNDGIFTLCRYGQAINDPRINYKFIIFIV